MSLFCASIAVGVNHLTSKLPDMLQNLNLQFNGLHQCTICFRLCRDFGTIGNRLCAHAFELALRSALKLTFGKLDGTHMEQECMTLSRSL